jgi:hypothetical protein
MSSERVSAVLDNLFQSRAAIDKLIERLQYEMDLGYYSNYNGQDMLRKVLKWASKYRDGED